MAADFFCVLTEDGLIKSVVVDQGTADIAQDVRVDLAVFVVRHEEKQDCADAVEVGIRERACGRGTGQKEGLADRIGTAVEEGEALIRENLAVQALAADNGIEEQSRIRFL